MTTLDQIKSGLSDRIHSEEQTPIGFIRRSKSNEVEVEFAPNGDVRVDDGDPVYSKLSLAAANARADKAASACAEMREFVKSIANADTWAWDDKSQFEPWAKNRARDLLAKLTIGQGRHSPEEWERLEKQYQKEQQEHLRTIKERDVAEECINRLCEAAGHVEGHDFSWSSGYTYEHAIEDVETKIAAKDARIAELEQQLAEARKFIEQIKNQKPEKPDYWSPCGQCENNASQADDILESIDNAKGAQQ